MPEYSLSNIVSHVGTFKLTLITPIVGLTVPSSNTITSLVKRERADMKPGSIEIPTLEVGIVEDFSTYVEGFWWKVLKVGGVELRVYLDEGNGDTFFFWGRIQNSATQWTEYMLLDTNADGIPDVVGRTPERITFVSLLEKLRDVSIDALVDELTGDPTGAGYFKQSSPALSPTPSVTPVGGTGTTTWGYRVAVRFANAAYDVSPEEMLWSDETLITNGVLNLATETYNQISWSAVSGAAAYAVYRTTAGGNPSGVGFIGVTTGTSFNDTGASTQALPQRFSARTFVKLHSIIGAMMRLAYGQTFSLADVPVRNDDIELQESGSWYKFSDAWMMAKTNEGSVESPNMQLSKYIDRGRNDKLYWGNRFRSSLELLGNICLMFGYVPRYYYDIAGGKHKIELLTRGRSFATTLTIDAPVESTIMQKSDLVTSAVKVNRTQSDQDYYASAYDLKEFDVQFKTDFEYSFSVTYPQDETERLFLESPAATFKAFTGSRFWDYSLDTTSQTSDFKATQGRYYLQLYNRQRTSYTRVYGGIRATESSQTSHAKLQIGKRTTIFDGQATVTYFANYIEQDVVALRTTIEWQEEGSSASALYNSAIYNTSKYG